MPYAAGYLDQLLQAGMAPYVDVISFHFYTYTAPPEQVGPGIAAHLDWPQAALVSAVRESSTKRLVVVRMHEVDMCQATQCLLYASEGHRRGRRRLCKAKGQPSLLCKLVEVDRTGEAGRSKVADSANGGARYYRS